MLEDVGRNLKRLRQERDLTQAQLARFARVPQQTVSGIEHGYVPRQLQIIDRLARALGVSPNELLKTTA